ncbi:hypothetical protein ACVXG9_19390 [Escherichia coli]
MSAKLSLTGLRSRYYSPELPGYRLYPGSERTGTVTARPPYVGKKMRHVGDRVAAVVAEVKKLRSKH